MGRNKSRLLERRDKAVVLDESHYIKNYKAQRTKNVTEIGKNAAIKLCLTGTPILNRPQELLSQLGFLDRLDDMGGFWHFAERYCNAQKTQWGWDFSGASHLEELNEKLRQHCYIRRNKADVLKELPPKQRTFVPVEITNRRDYGKAERDFFGWLKKHVAEDKKFSKSIAHLKGQAKANAMRERAFSKEQAALRAERLVKIEALKQLAANRRDFKTFQRAGNHGRDAVESEAGHGGRLSKQPGRKVDLPQYPSWGRGPDVDGRKQRSVCGARLDARCA